MSSLPFLTLGVHLQTKDSFVTSRVQNEYTGTDQRSHTKGTERHSSGGIGSLFEDPLSGYEKFLELVYLTISLEYLLERIPIVKSQHKPDSSRAFEHFTHYVSAMCLLIKFSSMVAFHWSNLTMPFLPYLLYVLML